MNMIRHDHVAPKRNTKLGNPAMTVSLQSKLSTMQRGDRASVTGCERDEVEWLISKSDEVDADDP
jgi:hypothetical protein